MKRPNIIDYLDKDIQRSGDYCEFDALTWWDISDYIGYLERWREQAIETHSTLEDMVLYDRPVDG